MLKSQMVVHRVLWILLVPLLAATLWLGLSHRGAPMPISQAPQVTEEAEIP